MITIYLLMRLSCIFHGFRECSVKNPGKSRASAPLLPWAEYDLPPGRPGIKDQGKILDQAADDRIA